jgi:type II secretory pathway pseudopilin PulG
VQELHGRLEQSEKVVTQFKEESEKVMTRFQLMCETAAFCGWCKAPREHPPPQCCLCVTCCRRPDRSEHECPIHKDHKYLHEQQQIMARHQQQLQQQLQQLQQQLQLQQQPQQQQTPPLQMWASAPVRVPPRGDAAPPVPPVDAASPSCPSSSMPPPEGACQNCAHALTPGKAYCGKCGAEAPTCGQCTETGNPRGSVYCVGCGKQRWVKK